MSKQFFIADTHFGHEKIIQLCNRPFENMKDMEKHYNVKLIGKNKGFYIIDCENHWHIERNDVKL